MTLISESSAPIPFSFSFSPQVPELLMNLRCTLAITTYQAGKVVLIRPNSDKERLSTMPRSFEKPMGMALAGNKMALATHDEIILFEASPELAVHYPNKPDTYDNLFVPRVTFHTGRVDMHDIKFGKDGIWAINTSFSCLCLVNGNCNFIPRWTPPFISNLVFEDRCHLNGLVTIAGVPKYITALGSTDTPKGWRNNIIDGGILMDIESNEIILTGLAMPHSPIIHKGELYLLLSATGEIIKADIRNKAYEVIVKVDGFCRGMAIYKDYMFVGLSKLRKNSSTFSKLPFSERAVQAGIKIFHIPTKAFAGEIIYHTSVDEIYAVEVFPDMINPNILNTINPVHKYALAMPGATFWADPESDTDN